MEHDSEEFTPIIAAGVEYSGVSNYRPPSQRAPVPRIPHNAPHVPAVASPHVSQRKVPLVTPTRSDSVLKKTASANGRIMSTPRTLVSQSKSLPFNYGVPEASMPRTSSGGTPVAVVKARNAGASEASTPSPYRTMSSGGIPVAPAKNRHAEPSTPRLRRSMSSAGVGDAVVKQHQQQSQAMSAEYRLSNGHGRGEDSAMKAAPIRHLSFSRGSFKQVSVDIRRLRQLARQGSWKLLIERVKDAQRRGLLASPDQEIAYGTYHLLALMKLQDYRVAAQEIAAFGDLDASQYRFENHPDLYPEKSGSMVPFALRCMHAELPHRIGKTAETLHRLYNLLAHCDSQIDALQAERCHDATESSSTPATSEGSATSDSDTAILEGLLLTWQKRLETVRFSIVGYHLHQQQFIVALQWLNKLMASSPSDPDVKTKVALVQVQLGDVVGAQRTFSDVEALLSSSSDPEMKNLLARNRGIMFVALGEFPKAIAEFDAVLAADPNDIVSANNKALCLLYNQRLVDATDVLEDAIFRGPKLMINEAVIGNICNMYEVVSFSGAATKRSLRTWMKEHGPDDFDATMFRL